MDDVIRRMEEMDINWETEVASIMKRLEAHQVLHPSVRRNVRTMPVPSFEPEEIQKLLDRCAETKGRRTVAYEVCVRERKNKR